MQLFVLNFGYALSEKCLTQIKEQYNGEVDVIEVALSASFDVRKCLYPQVVSFLNQLNIPLDGSVPYIVNAPNLSIIAFYILTELTARTGAYPKVLELIRDDTLGVFILKRIVNLEYERRMTRNRRRKFQLREKDQNESKG